MPSPPANLAAPRADRHVLLYIALCALTALIYAPSLGYGFVWDDFDLIVNNSVIHGLTPAHWRAMWLHAYSGLYSPVHQSGAALIYAAGGGSPLAFHAAQVLLHAASACALFAVVRGLETRLVAGVAAALFAVHPANIENVAWATELKSTLALLFFLLSLLLYLRHERTARWSDALLCATFFALSLLSKPSTIVAPGVLFLLLFVRFSGDARQPARTRWILLAVLFVSAVALTLLTLKYQRALGVDATPDRLMDATILATGEQPLGNIDGFYGGRVTHLLNLPGYIYFYVKTTVWPAQLAVWQMFPVQTAWSGRAATLWLALLLAAGGICWAWFVPRWRGWAFWALWFLIFLLPVLQLFPNPIWVADRYLYIPAIGLFVLFGKLVQELAAQAAGRDDAQAARRDSAWAQRAVLAPPAVVLLALIWTSVRYLPAWRSDVALWSAAMKSCYRSAYCHDMLGLALRRTAAEATTPEEVARLRHAAVEEAALSADMRPTPQKFIYLGDALTEIGDRRAFDAYRKTQEMMGQLPSIYWAQIIKAHYRFGNLTEAARLLEMLRRSGSSDPTLLMVGSFVDWKQGRTADSREAVRRIMEMNTLVPPGPERTLNFIARYWGDRAETAQMLREVGAP